MDSQIRENEFGLPTGFQPTLQSNPFRPDLKLPSPDCHNGVDPTFAKAAAVSTTDSAEDGWETLDQELISAKVDRDDAGDNSGAAAALSESSAIPYHMRPVIVPVSVDGQNKLPNRKILPPDDTKPPFPNRNQESLPRPAISRQDLPFRPQVCTSYRNFFNGSDDDDANFFYDKFFLLQPFNRLVVGVQTTFEKEEFRRWAWLLGQREEKWYTMPSAGTLSRMRASGIEKRAPVKNPQPACLKTPRIVAGDSLYLDLYGDEQVERCCGECHMLHPDDICGSEKEERGEDENSNSDNDLGEEENTSNDSNPRSHEDVWDCIKCYEKYKQLHDDVGWVYLSVVRTERQMGSDENRGDGTGMFMLRKNSSRELAAAQAFYDAGALGWSTLFVCAIRADADLFEWSGKVERVINYVQRVLVLENGILRVFF